MYKFEMKRGFIEIWRIYADTFFLRRCISGIALTKPFNLSSCLCDNEISELFRLDKNNYGTDHC